MLAVGRINGDSLHAHPCLPHAAHNLHQPLHAPVALARIHDDYRGRHGAWTVKGELAALANVLGEVAGSHRNPPVARNSARNMARASRLV